MSLVVEEENITKMVSYKFISLLRLLFGHYYNINNSKPVRYLAKLYCICFCFLNTFIFYYVILSNDFQKKNLINGKTFLFLPLILNTVSSLVFADNYFDQYCSTIETNDTIMGFKTPLITKGMSAIFVITILLRLSLSTMGYLFSEQPFPLLLTTSIVTLSLDMNHIQAAWILCLLHSRMCLLTGFFKRISIPININGNRHGVRVCVKNVRKGLYNYNALLNDVQYVDKQMQCLLIAAFLACLPKTIVFIYETAFNYMRNEECSLIVLRISGLVYTMYLLALPMAITQAIICEVDEIKTILSRKLLRCSDECVRSELEAALEYISLRPFKYNICRIISMDINLLYTVISVCLTYAIVILQFTRFAA